MSVLNDMAVEMEDYENEETIAETLEGNAKPAIENIYTKALKEYLGDIGTAVIDWLNENTTNEEFYEQPVSIHQPERLLIKHAVSMFDKIVRLSKLVYSKKVSTLDDDGNQMGEEWIYKPEYTNEQLAQVALLHVIGGIRKYKKEIKPQKDPKTGRWKDIERWWFDGDRPCYGSDGDQAVAIIQDIFSEYDIAPLDFNVMGAIKHISGVLENPTQSGRYATIWKQNRLALLAHIADMFDTFFECNVNSTNQNADNIAARD